jgi:hypothetical protein
LGSVTSAEPNILLGRWMPPKLVAQNVARSDLSLKMSLDFLNYIKGLTFSPPVMSLDLSLTSIQRYQCLTLHKLPKKSKPTITPANPYVIGFAYVWG